MIPNNHCEGCQVFFGKEVNKKAVFPTGWSSNSKFSYSGTLTNENLRTIRADEMVFEPGEKDKIKIAEWEKIFEENVKKYNLRVEKWSHKGEACHFHLKNIVNPLPKEDKKVKDFISSLLCVDKHDTTLNKKENCISIENVAHWKHGTVKKLKKVINPGGKNVLPKHNVLRFIVEHPGKCKTAEKFVLDSFFGVNKFAEGQKKHIDLLPNISAYFDHNVDLTREFCKIIKHPANDGDGWCARESVYNCKYFSNWLEKNNFKYPKCNGCGDDYFISNMKELKSRILTLLLSAKKKPHLRKKATELACKAFKHYNHPRTIRHDKVSEMWTYNNGVFTPNGVSRVKEFCREVLGEVYSTTFFNQVYAKIEADTFVNSEDFFINEDINLIPLQNGIYSLKDNVLLPFSPKYKFFSKMPVHYKHGQDCPKIKTFFEQVLASDNDIKLMQEIFGYSMYRSYEYEKLFMFSASGRNGKSKIIELLKRFIGTENMSNVPLQDLSSDMFSMAGLHNKWVNTCADIGRRVIKDSSKLKALSGGDDIQAPRKFLTRIKFKNFAKLIFSANELPRTMDDTDAFWTRWELVEFPYQFFTGNEYENRKNEKNVKKADTQIIEKISSQEELDGLFNWALEGLRRLQQNDDFTSTQLAEDVKSLWKRKSDSLGAFLGEYVEFDKGNMTKQEFRDAYKLYCEKYRLKAEGDKKIKKFLNNENRIMEGAINNVRYWLNITIRTSFYKDFDLEKPLFKEGDAEKKWFGN